MSLQEISKKTFSPTPLEELTFAQAEHPWEEQAAFQRLLATLGWAAIATYSLWVQTTGEAESEETYQLLVVDLVDGKPKIVPAALDAAADKLSRMDEAAKEKVEAGLAVLQERFRRATAAPDNEGFSQTHSPEETVDESKLETQEEATEDAPSSLPEDQETAQQAVSNNPSPESLESARLLVDRLAREGRLLAAWGSDALIRFIAGLSDEPTINTEGLEPFSPRAFFIRLIESLPALVPLTEIASPAAPQDNSLETLGHRIAASLHPTNLLRSSAGTPKRT